MRGKDDRVSIELAVAELYGGIRQNIINFSAETGVSASWVAARISELLSPPRERVLDHLSAMQLEATGNGRAVEPMALAVDAHRGPASATNEGQRASGQNGKGKVSPTKAWYDSLTPKQKRTVTMDRLRKRTDAMGKKMLAGMLKNEKKKSHHAKVDPAKRRIYTARYAAKLAGVTPPPLPGQEVA